MRRIYDTALLRKYYREIGINIFLLIGISILSIAGPLLLREAIDYELAFGYDKTKILMYTGLLTALYALKFVYQRFRHWFTEKFKNQETVELYRKIFHMRYEKINYMEPTYIVERVQDTIGTIFQLYCSSITGIFVSALTMALILFVVFQINYVLALLYFLQIPLQYFGFKKLLNGEESKLCRLGEEVQRTRAKNNKDIKAIVSDVDSMKQYCDTEGLISMIEKRVSEINSVERKGNAYAMDVCTILEYVALALKNCAYIYIVVLYVTGGATVGDMIYLNLINDIYFNSVSDVINIQVNLRDLHGATRFVTEEIDKSMEDDGEIELSRIEKMSGEIHNIGYKDDVLIKNGQFEFEPGDIVAIMGESGCGKSTFVRTLNKFLITDGIEVNGYDIADVTNKSLRKRVCYLPQNSYLLPFSIKDNITLGEEVSKERWEKLLRMDFMKKFVDRGMEELVYENASNLSGGDRQKIILGRIFLQDPDVIILDESFHAIDEKTGEDILNMLISLYADKIILIISHSDQYLRYCNKKFLIHEKELKQIFS